MMYYPYRYFLIAALICSTSLICQEKKEKEKVDASCRELITSNGDSNQCDLGNVIFEENLTHGGTLSPVAEIQIMTELAHLFQDRPLNQTEAAEIAEFLRPHMETFAVISLCRLSEKSEVSIQLVDRLIKLAKKEDVEKALTLLAPSNRNSYVMNAMINKAFNRPADTNCDEEIELSNLFNKHNKSVLAVLTLGYLGNRDTLDAEMLEIAMFLIGQVNPHDLEISLAINTYKNDDIVTLMTNKLLSNAAVQIEELYGANKTLEEKEAIAATTILELKAENDKLKHQQQRRLLIARLGLAHCGLSSLSLFVKLLCIAHNTKIPATLDNMLLISFVSSIFAPAWLAGASI